MKNIGNWKRIGAAVLLAVLCAAFVVFYWQQTRGGDRTAPEISVPGNTLELSVTAPEADYLAGITAQDDTDGDVTGLLLLEGVSDMYGDDMVEITVAAFDAAGNVSKAKREVHYTDYEGPKFTLNRPLVFPEGSSLPIFEAIGAVDPRDGNLSSRVKGTLVEGGSYMDEVGVYQVEFRVTNSVGDTAHLTLPVEITAEDILRGGPELTEYLVYIPKGAAFRERDYLKKTKKQSADQPEPTISVRSDLDVNVPGLYTAWFTDVDTKGQSRLLIVVEE